MKQAGSNTGATPDSDPRPGGLRRRLKSLESRIRNAVLRWVDEDTYFKLTVPLRLLRILANPTYERELPLTARWAGKGSVCLDIGANHGRYTRVLARFAGPSGQVHAFEPVGYNRQVLRALITFLRLRNVIIIPEAVSNRPGKVRISIPSKQHGLAGFALSHIATGPENAGRSEEVTAVTLDEYCTRAGLSRLDFIKCDVEGAEYLVFEGAHGTLERWHPAVLCEIHEPQMGIFGTSPDGLFRLFSDAGYSAFTLSSVTRELETIESFHGHGVVIFLPSGASGNPG